MIYERVIFFHNFWNFKMFSKFFKKPSLHVAQATFVVCVIYETIKRFREVQAEELLKVLSEDELQEL
jgi:hypothetical protein